MTVTSVAVATAKFLLAYVIEWLMVMLARAIFRSWKRLCTCVDRPTCNRTCLRASTGAHRDAYSQDLFT